MNPLTLVNLLEIVILVGLLGLFWGSEVLLRRLGDSAPIVEPNSEGSRDIFRQ